MNFNNGYLYIYSAGRIAKVNKQNGEVIWQTKLRDVGISSATVANMQLDGDKIFIGANGALVCVSEKDGEVIWSNTLSGWGYNYIIFANQEQTSTAINHKIAQSSNGSNTSPTSQI